MFFFCFGGQGVALAADVATPIVTAAGSEKGEASVAMQGDAVTADSTQNSGVVAGRVHLVVGEVRSVNESGDVRILQKGGSINVGDTVISAEGASAQIRMEDGGLIMLRPESQLKFDSFKFSGKEDGTENSFFTLSQGGFRAVTGLIGRINKQSYRITTPAAVIGISGTDHEIVYLTNDVSDTLAGTYNKVNSGRTTLTTDAGTVNVESGQMGYSGSMGVVPQILPINPSLFNEAASATAEGFAAAMGADLATEPTASADEESSEAEKSAAAAKENVAAEPEEPVGPMFVLAPILWGGNVSESLRKQRFEQGESSLQNVQTANLRAWTYVWQPWLAQLGGGIGLVNAKNVSGTSTNDNISLNGRGNLSVVPYSRYPFFASYYSTDDRDGSRAFTPATNFGSNSTGFEVQQHYRPISNSSNSLVSYNRDRILTQGNNSAGGMNRVNSILHLQHDYRLQGSPSLFSVGYDRNTNSLDGQGGAVVTGLHANGTTSFNQQYLDVNTVNNDSEYTQGSSRYSHVTVRHAYRPDRLLSVSTSAYANQFKSLTLGQNSSYTRNLQLDSSTSWQPDEELPFYVFGSVRIFDTVYDTPSTLIVSQSQIATASVNYAATPNLTYEVHETLANTRPAANSAKATLTGGNASYISDDTKLGSAFRKWRTNGGIDYQTNSSSASNLIFFGGAGQIIRLPYALDEGELDYTFNQSLSVRESGIFGRSGTLTHSGGATWKPDMVKSLSGAVNFTLSDIRSFGDTSTNLQVANLAVNALHSISVYSSAVAIASVVWSGNDRGQSSKAAKVDVKYNHTRAFNVKGLRYTLTININKYQSKDFRYRENSRDGYLIDQKLEYAIGRAYLRLNAAIIKNANLKSTLIVLQFGRNFGQL